MDRKALTRLSKYLSFVLRHQPGSIGVAMDGQGWVDVEELIERSRPRGVQLTREVIAEIVATSPKRRFALSEDGRRLRANQGHSVDVDLAYEPSRPPELLFHGTAAARLPAIRAEGLKKMGRHHVHLSPDPATARAVGMRRGQPVVLRIAAARMHREGHVFYRSANGVWLVERVPPEFIDVPGP